MLTRSWRLGRAQAACVECSRPLRRKLIRSGALQPSAAPRRGSAIASDRVRSTVASLETMTSSQRAVCTSGGPAAALPAPVPQLASQVPAMPAARCATSITGLPGVPNNVSREMYR